jgi:ABC-2 type transport system ATP-binding protein
MAVAIEVRDLTKKFKKGKRFRKGEVVAVDRASFAIEEGELFGLLGPNGAGKTTLVRCLANLLIPNEGEISIFGRSFSKDPLLIRRQIGITTGGERTLYWKLSGKDNLSFFAALYGLYGKQKEKRIDYLMDFLDLKEVKNERVERYSSGMRQKISLARALLHDPKILLLDEPTLGLDPQFSRFIRSFIKDELNRKQKKTILLTTHYMDEADELCGRIAFINKGKVVEVNTPSGFKKELPQKEVLEVRCLGSVNQNTLAEVKGVEKISVVSKDGVSHLKVITARGEDVLSDLIESLREEVKILSIDLKEPTLEDVFIHVTGRGLGEEEYQS